MPNKQVHSKMREALLDVRDPRVLFQLGLTNDEKLPATEVERVVTAFLNSPDFAAMRWGTFKELLLLSLAYGGQLAFLVFFPGTEHLAPAIVRYVAPDAVPAPVTMEVALYYCNVSGNEDGEINHWNLFTYRMQDGSIMKYWPCCAEESDAHRQHRMSLLAAARGPASAKAAKRAAELERKHRDLAMEWEKQDGGGISPSLPPTTTAAAAAHVGQSARQHTAGASSRQGRVLTGGICVHLVSVCVCVCVCYTASSALVSSNHSDLVLPAHIDLSVSIEMHDKCKQGHCHSCLKHTCCLCSSIHE